MAIQPIATSVPRHVAFLKTEGRVFSAISGDPDLDSPLRFSAAANLLQALWFHFPKDARRWVRNRIETSEPRNLMAQSFKKLIGKRISYDSFNPYPDAIQLDFDEKHGLEDSRIDTGKFPRATGDFPGLLLKEARGANRSEKRFENDREVSAALVSASGEILTAHRNGNRLIRSRHAEIQVCNDWWLKNKSPFPKGSRLWVSLQCCEMCAVAVASLAAGKPLRTEKDFPQGIDFQVLYLKKETCGSAANSVLRALGLERAYKT
ncbi:MAG: Bd3614 family nucleic acid deaminase [Bdellovibrionales bacterium]|nr:Bd3614 family nucleic acid deaminase [Bdellovibrionales bacterium]